MFKLLYSDEITISGIQLENTVSNWTGTYVTEYASPSTAQIYPPTLSGRVLNGKIMSTNSKAEVN